MNRRLLSIIATAALAATAAMAAPPSASPSPSPAPRPSSRPSEATTKFAAATKEQIEFARVLAEKLYAEAKKSATNMHLVETDHFLIYSEWEKSADKPLTDLAEGLYAALCKQFDIPVKQNIWIGKCPIYTFRNTEHFHDFTKATVGDSNKLMMSAGYCSSRNGLCYLVMDYRNSLSDFNTILVHESTHAFISRYLTNRNIPQWLNEGLAETMASTLVPEGFATYRWKNATREAVATKANISKVFEDVRLVDFDYGIVQSVVQFLISRDKDKKSFIKLFTLLKEGKSEEEALQESYKLTRQDLIKAWSAAVGIR